MFVIFDLDGTLGCTKHRAHMLEQNPRPWDEFYRACVHDAPLHPIINVMRALRAAGARIEVWTGRSDLVLAETVDWFSRHGVPQTYIRMRPHGDHEADDEMKERWLLECDAMPDLVFEDRARVVAMWRRNGIQCCQVAEGDF